MTIAKAIYEDNDSRCNLYELPDKIGENATSKIARITRLAKSVGCLVWQGNFEDRSKEDSPWSVNKDFFNKSKATLKSHVESKSRDSFDKVAIRFEQEPCLGQGTAFLIGKDLILTAAHCIFNKKNPEKKVPNYPKLWIAGFEHQPGREYKYPLTFEHDNVYKIQSVFAHKLSGEKEMGQDWAILKLDREVKGREPLKINFSAQITSTKEVWVLGHPWGLPIKWAGKSTIMTTDSKESGKDYFETDLPTFEGNSGSPVFFDDNSEEVIGMICYGKEDYVVKGNVLTENNLTKEESEQEGYEKSLKMTSLTFLKGVLPSIDRSFPKPPVQYKKGLSLEGDCNNCHQLVVHPVGFTNESLVDIAEQCCKAKCPHCKQGLEYDDVNTMVLSQCTYEIDAMNTDKSKVIGTFHLRSLDSGGVMRFDVQKWLYIELKVKSLANE